MLVLSRAISPEQADQICGCIDGVEFVFAQDEREDIFDKAKDLDGLINCPRHIFDLDLFNQLQPRLKWLHSGGAGVEAFLFPEFVQSDVVFTNGQILQGPEVSEHAVGLLLALTRNLHLVIKGKTSAEMPRPIELYNKTAAVIGLGGIGMLVCEKLRAMGMRIIGIDEGMVPMVSSIDTYQHFKDGFSILGKADVVVNAAPETARSFHMMNKESFSKMKAGSYFINVSRGPVVDTDALVEALQSGHLTAAGLDVTEPEPLSADHPLRLMENVIITPHSAGLSDCNRDRVFETIRRNIELFVAGQPLCNIVNKQAGY